VVFVKGLLDMREKFDRIVADAFAGTWSEPGSELAPSGLLSDLQKRIVGLIVSWAAYFFLVVT
jgi:hypothetical protein